MNQFQFYQDLTQRISSHIKAEQYEIIIEKSVNALTRFANSSIHQNVQSQETEIHLRLVNKLQSSVTNTTDISDEGISAFLKKSHELLANSPENELEVRLPSTGETIELNSPKTDQTEAFKQPEYRAQIVSKMCHEAKKNSIQAFGSFSTQYHEIFIKNSENTTAFSTSTQTQLISQMMKDSSSGFAQSTASHIRMVETDRVLHDSVELCLKSQHARQIEPGEYEVILMPEATQDILSMMAYMGFSTNSIHEGRSFLSDKLNQPVLDAKLSISDFSQHSLQHHLPFDFEGVPKRKVELIKDGFFHTFVTDSHWARKLQMENTGHALKAPNPFGPFPFHLVVETNTDNTVQDLISQAKKAVLITRFWYANPIHPKTGTCTGLTRDGTFLIENGKIAYPIRNVRYTDNLVELLNHILAFGKEKRYYHGFVAPAVYCQSMRFVSQAPAT